MRRGIYVILVGLWLAAGAVSAQERSEPPLRFRQLTIDDGLSQNAIYALAHDREGFTWIGTKDGLNRYDGYTFTVYRHDPFDTTTLPSGYVTALLESRRGAAFWVGTQDGGLGRIDRTTGRTVRYPTVFPSRITTLAEDADGALWIGTVGHGLYRIRAEHVDRPGAPLDTFRHQDGDPSSLASDDVRALLVDRAGTLWIGTAQGLDRFQEGGFLHVTYQASDPDGLMDTAASALHQDGAGRLWVGSPRGLSRLDDAVRGRFSNFPIEAQIGGSDHVTRMAEGPSGKLWLATLDGLVRFDPDTERYTRVRHDPRVPTSLAGDGVSAVGWDRAGVLWVGTNGYGLSLYDAKAARFETIRRPADPTSRLDGFSVRAIYEAQDGVLWISANVLYRYDRQTGTLQSFEGPKARPEAFGNAGVRSIIQDQDGQLWFGSSEGLYRRDPATGATRRYAYDAQAPDGLPEQVVYGVFQSRAGALWVVTAHYLARLDDEATGRFSPFLHSPLMPEGAAEAVYPSLHESNDGLFWMGTETGLVRFDPATGDVHRYRTDPGDASSLRAERVRAILPDPSDPDVLWLGTAGGGLARFDRRTETFRHITQADGLPNNVVYAVLPDGQGRLWLSTNLGLARYNPQTGAVKTYDVRDGLQSNEFNSGAYHQTPDGRIYVGGIHGVTAFDPDALEDNPHIPPILLTGLRVGNRPVAVGDSTGLLDQALWATETLRLGHRQSMVTFEFVALDFSAPEKNRYAYQMEGYDDAWIEGGTNRTATYTRLPPGRYTFRVRGTNNDGVWNDEGTALAVVVAPPPWRTGWAYLAYALVLFGIGLAVYRDRQRRLRLRQRLEREHLEAGKLRELDRAKSRLFANVSHEFRTPLTLTIGPLDDLQAGRMGPLTPEALAHVDLARRNAASVLGLVTQILDIARLEAGQLPLRARPLDLGAFVATCAAPFQASSERQGVVLDIEGPPAALEVWADPEHLARVVRNLLSNALKYTPADGAVRVTVSAQDGAAQIAVRDTGSGIPAEALPYVFDRFYRVRETEHEQAGTGIGLALAKEIVELHGGTLVAESEEGVGSAFTVTLQMGRAHLDPRHLADTPEPSWAPEGSLAEEPAGRRPTHEATTEEPDDDDNDDRTTVLVVEDHADVRAYVRSHLEAPGPDGPAYRVIEAPDGEAGLALARSHLPDLIVSDVMMPRLDGFGLCRALRADAETDFIPIILLTAKAETEDRLQGLAEACDDYLTKPFEPRELRARVDNLIAQRQRLRERYRQDGIALVLGEDEAPALHPTPVAVDSADAAFMDTVRAAIEARLDDEEFTVDSLADAAGLSRAQLYRRLKAVTGETPSAFLQRMRLERAAALLRARAGTVSEVAYAVGFKSVAHFSKRFAQHLGCRPSMYAAEGAPDRASLASRSGGSASVPAGASRKAGD